MDDKHSGGNHSEHHILSDAKALKVGGALLVLTAITVAVAHINLGEMNFVVAFAIATLKATLVALWFMGLKFDKRENGVIFGASFLFLAIFITLTSTDLFFRGDVYFRNPIAANVVAKSRFKKPWIATPEILAYGKEQFQLQCTSCHGAQGKGDGPAAAALNPHPRNFTQNEGWKNGRRVTMIFKTLKEGLPPSAMASFGTLPADDRWALAQYVLSLGPQPAPKDTARDFAAISVNPEGDSGAGGVDKPSIPIELAIDRLAVPDDPKAEAPRAAKD